MLIKSIKKLINNYRELTIVIDFNQLLLLYLTTDKGTNQLQLKCWLVELSRFPCANQC